MFFDPWPDFNVIMINPAEMIAPPAMSLELMVNGELAWFLVVFNHVFIFNDKRIVDMG